MLKQPLCTTYPAANGHSQQLAGEHRGAFQVKRQIFSSEVGTDQKKLKEHEYWTPVGTNITPNES